MMMAYSRVVAVEINRSKVLRTDSGRLLESGIDRPPVLPFITHSLSAAIKKNKHYVTPYLQL